MVIFDKDFAKKARYIAVFFDEKTQEELRKFSKHPLGNPTGDLHVTVEYKPADEHRELFSEKVRVNVIAYGNNCKNEGLKVELHTKNVELQALLNSIAVPHITLSWSDDSKAVHTCDVDFNEPVAFECEGTFGAFVFG